MQNCLSSFELTDERCLHGFDPGFWAGQSPKGVRVEFRQSHGDIGLTYATAFPCGEFGGFTQKDSPQQGAAISGGEGPERAFDILSPEDYREPRPASWFRSNKRLLLFRVDNVETLFGHDSLNRSANRFKRMPDNCHRLS